MSCGISGVLIACVDVDVDMDVGAAVVEFLEAPVFPLLFPLLPPLLNGVKNDEDDEGWKSGSIPEKSMLSTTPVKNY